MMLKCMDSKGVWMLFDGADQITWRRVPKKEAIGMRADVVDLRVVLTMAYEDEVPKADREEVALKEYWEFWLYKMGQVVKQVLVDNPIYILNDEGKTIERIMV